MEKAVYDPNINGFFYIKKWSDIKNLSMFQSLFNISQSVYQNPCYDEITKEKGVIQVMICEWNTFSTDSETYTLDAFEAAVGDEFEAMMFKEKDPVPAFIWTVNYVIIVKRRSNVLTEISFEKIPRNPVCE